MYEIMCQWLIRFTSGSAVPELGALGFRGAHRVLTGWSIGGYPAAHAVNSRQERLCSGSISRFEEAVSAPIAKRNLQFRDLFYPYDLNFVKEPIAKYLIVCQVREHRHLQTAVQLSDLLPPRLIYR